MNINIADNLKRLRKQREITQEALADFIGVSFQAVSKWERGDGYPDITILPVIANFFNVSLDELVGMDEIKDAQRLEGTYAKLKENASVGKIEENIAILREEVKRYPNNYELLSKLSNQLTYANVSDDIEKKNNYEALQINRRILKFCTDSNIRAEAQWRICMNYFWLEDNENGAKEANKLPSAQYSREAAMSLFLKGDELVNTAQYAIRKLAGIISGKLGELADVNHEKGLNWTNAERIAILEKDIKLYEFLYEDGDYLFNHIYISNTYSVMAALSLLDSKWEQTLDYIEKSADHLVSFVILPPEKKHTSILVNTIEYDVLDTAKNYEGSDIKIMLDKLANERYNPVRADERFAAVVEKLKQYE